MPKKNHYNSVSQIWWLARMELKSFWSGIPAGLSLLVFLSLSGFFFYNSVVSYSIDNLKAVASGLVLDASVSLFSQGLTQQALILMLITPLATMRSLAPFRRGGHFDFYQSMPVKHWQIILGQFLAAWISLAGLLILGQAPFFALWLAGLGSWEMLVISLGGFIVLAASFAAVGLLAAAASPSPMGAAFITLGGLGLMWVLGWAAPYLDQNMAFLIQGLAFRHRVERFVMGVIDLNDLLFMAVMAALALWIAGKLLAARSVSGAD